MIRVLLAALAFFSFRAACAQQENTWAFGTDGGLDFNSGTPQFISTSMIADEACASVCGANGRLLFYTEGTYVWDSTGNVMPNGDDLAATTPPAPGFTTTQSTAQGALIVPMPDSAGKYYIFSLTAESGYLYYSVLDMSLHNGLGDIVPGRKAILLDSLLSERMTAVAGNDCNIWLLTCSLEPKFKAFKITSDGISANPAVSSVGIGGSLGLDFMGCMTVSPDRTRLAATSCLPVTDMVSAALFDFDATTGLVSNPLPLILDTASNAAFSYSVAFSPDNSKLYVNSLTAETVDQFDLSQGNNAVMGTRTTIGATGFSAMKMGPDGKLYFFTNVAGTSPGQVLTNHAIGCIGAPNLAGSACQYNNQVLLLPTQTAPVTGGWDYGTGLPNVVAPALKTPDPVITLNGAALSTAGGYDAYQWFRNDTAIAGATDSAYTVTAIGDYTVQVTGKYNCSATAPVYTVDHITGIENTAAANRVSIYPNPAVNDIYIRSSFPVTVQLFSLEGKLLEQVADAEHISLAPYAKGIYGMKILDKKGTLIRTEKIVKIK